MKVFEFDILQARESDFVNHRKHVFDDDDDHFPLPPCCSLPLSSLLPLSLRPRRLSLLSSHSVRVDA